MLPYRVQVIQLPKPIVPSVTLKAQLDGADYIIDVRWNMRGGWFIGVSDAAGVPITAPRRAVINWNLMSGCTDVRRPPGVLALMDTSGTKAECGYADLGVRCELQYFSVEEG